jgi:hypothetical protein
MKQQTQSQRTKQQLQRCLINITVTGIMALSGMASALALDAEAKDDAVVIQAADPVVTPVIGTRFDNFYATEQLNFAIDPVSITIQKNGELRYILKISSKQGAVNISYEGIQCATHQKILYAFGQSDGSWSTARNPQWSDIFSKGTNLQHNELASYYFCMGNGNAGRLIDIQTRFEMKRPMSN